MIEAWLDTLIPWWRDFTTFYSDHFGLIVLPLLAWMATIFIGQRTNSAALAAITTHLKKLATVHTGCPRPTLSNSSNR